MSTDISEEAKIAIANAGLVRARQRLVRDGCRTDAAMRRRLLVLAAERNLPPADCAKLLHKRIMMKSIQEFCRKHNVSLDWLMDGDLKGLQRMKQWAKEDHGMRADERRAEILRKLLALTPSNQKSYSNGSRRQRGATPMRKPKTKKAAKTRANKLPEQVVCHPVDAKRAKAYHDMESHVCDLSRAAELAMAVFDQPELFLHAVGQLDDMAQRFRANYYAEEFPI